MFALKKSKNKTSSRLQMAISGARDGILILPNNQYRVVLEVSSLNFELKSEAEQDTIIDIYESFLNSVGVPLQILIRTREIDIEKYLEDISIRLETEDEDVYRQQLINYDYFIRSLITSNKILTRRFYVIVPYIRTINHKIDFEIIKEQLGLTADIVAKGLGRLGMSARSLSSLEILDLFYSFYNPLQSKVQPLSEKAFEMMHDMLVKKKEQV